MTVYLRITPNASGTVARTLRFLSSQSESGTVIFSFGKEFPEATIHLLKGDPQAAKFGELIDGAVFDFLLCQENLIKEIAFEPPAGHEYKPTMKLSMTAALSKASRGVKRCAARSFIYAPLPVHVNGLELEPTITLGSLLHDFSQYRNTLESALVPGSIINAPLPQCALLRLALNQNVIRYLTPLVPLSAFQPIVEFLQPMDDLIAKNLQGYLNSLLPNYSATHLPLERIYAYASAIESIAYSQGAERGDSVRKMIFKVVTDFGSDGPGASGAKVPAGGGGPSPSGRPHSAEVKLPGSDQNDAWGGAADENA